MIKQILKNLKYRIIDLLKDPETTVEKELSFKDYQEKAMKTAIFAEEYKIIYPALALSEEIGELNGKLAKTYRDFGGCFSEAIVEAIFKEMGDILWQLSAIAAGFDFNLEDVAQGNLDKLKDRQERNVLSGSGDNR